MLFLYHLLTTLCFIFFFPYFYLLKNRNRFRERLGLDLSTISQSRAGRIWVHALSVGEVLSAIPLLEALKSKHPSREIVLSVKTATGLNIARKNLGNTVQHVLPMPLDFWWSASKMIKTVNPIIFILIETDIWPGLISLLRKSGVKTVLVNGRLSPHTAKSYRRWRFFIKRVLTMLELLLMQTEIDKRRIMEGGISSDKVKVTGNIKFDKSWKPLSNKEKDKWLRLLNLKNKLIWVAGSTHHPEEKIIFNIFRQLNKSFADLSLIIGPREANRFDEVYNIAKDCGLKVIRRTQLSPHSTATAPYASSVREEQSETGSQIESQIYDVLILNTFGELDQMYGLADIAFVGGSLAAKGGHNLLEPAFFGIPVIFGPHIYNFLAMSELIINCKGGKMVSNESELLNVVSELLTRKSKREEMGKRAKEFVEQNQGALARVIEILTPYIEMSKV